MSGSHDRYAKSNDEYQEAVHLAEVIATFKRYARLSMAELKCHANHWKTIPEAHRRLLPDFLLFQKASLDQIIVNQRFIDALLHASASIFESNLRYSIDLQSIQVSVSNFDKMKSTLRQFVREWSAEGTAERQQSYGRVVDRLCELYPDESKRRDIRVLTPGAGLGRLTWEIARNGFSSEGNEFSYFMLLGSHYILNCMRDSDPPLVIVPFVHQTTNVIRPEDRIRQFTVPDLKPSCFPLSGTMTMTAGDFTEVYAHDPSAFHAVVTCFFLDTAHNIIDYIEKISVLLQPGGYWVNLGPLLYHYSDSDDLSIEISLEEVRKVIPAFGLEIISWSFPHECRYVSNTQSMMHFVYQCAFFTCRKT